MQKEFEAFGFFLNEHPLDDKVLELRKRGAVFFDKIEKDELEDGDIIKMAGVVATSKHRSGPKGRFAYLTISDPFGIFEAMIFDEAIITNARDLLTDGSSIAVECSIRKDEGGIRILIREVKSLEDFIRTAEARDEIFEDIKKRSKRKFDSARYNGGDYKPQNLGKFAKSENSFAKKPAQDNSAALHKSRLEQLEAKKIYDKIEIFVDDREAVFALKVFLSSRVAPENFAKFSRVFLCVGGVQNGAQSGVRSGGQNFKIELGGKYLLDDADVARLKGLEKVAKVEVS